MPLWYWMLGFVFVVSFTIVGYMSSTARKMLGCMGLAVLAIGCVAIVLALAGGLLYGAAWALRQGWGHEGGSMSESVSEANAGVLRFPVMFEVSGWVSDADRCVRRWVVPEVEADEAIIVYQAKGTWWPFRKFAWEVYAPYCNDALVEGTATSMEDAQRQADEALQQCAKLAAADVVSCVRVVEDAAHYQSLYLAERRLRLAERISSEALIKTGDSSPESLAALHEEAEARAALLRLGGEP